VIRSLILLNVLVLLTCSVALGYQAASFRLTVSSGALYDYVVLGEHPKATDGFDNAYDTVSPGNLNAALGQPFLGMLILYPDRKPAQRELKGDFRSPAARQSWTLAVTSSLPKGTALEVTLKPERLGLPLEAAVLLREPQSPGRIDLRKGSRKVAAPGPGAALMMTVEMEQP
jgi:hypothetical protein